MTDGDQLTGQQQALLVEYQALQHDNSSSGTSYWAMAAIFIGISSALLVGVIYGILGSSNVFEGFISAVTTTGVEYLFYGGYKINAMVWGLRIITLVLGIGIIIILLQLKGWMGRVTFLQQINFIRMREIELELGMWKSWRVHALDEWYKIRNDELSDKDLWDKLQEKLKENLNTKCSELLDKREQALVDLIQHYFPLKRHKDKLNKYESSSQKFFDCIFCTIFSLWCVLVLSVWAGLPVEWASELDYFLNLPSGFTFILLIIIILIIILAVVLKHCRRKEHSS